jgi:hypothetical protein
MLSIHLKNTNRSHHRHSNIFVLLWILMKHDGWLREPNGEWVLRFKYDWDSWDQNPKVFIDKGRLITGAIPLLKSRKRMRRKLAIVLWRDLLASGWKRVKPQWE